MPLVGLILRVAHAFAMTHSEPGTDQLTRPEPTQAIALCEHGEARCRAGDYDAALCDFNEAIRIGPPFARAHVDRAVAFYSKGQLEQAAEDCSTALQIDPNAAQGYVWRGAVRVQQGRLEEGIADYTEALRLAPENANTYLCRGAALHAQNRYDEALADYAEAIRRAPNDARAYVYRGHTHDCREEFEAAIADYSQALRLATDDAETYLSRGTAYYRDERYEEALEDYSQFIRLAPDDFRGHLYRGRTHRALQEYEEALADLNRALQADPGCVEAFVERGHVRRFNHEPEAALADYDEAIRLDPNHAEAYGDRGATWMQLEQYEKAIADLSEALRLDPNHESAYETRCRAYERNGQEAKADEDFAMMFTVVAQKDDSLPAGSPPRPPERSALVYTLLQRHFDPLPLEGLAITERRFPGRVRADLQRAIDSLFEQMTVCHFCGVRKQYCHEGVNFTELVVRDRNDPALSVPPQYEEIDIGEDNPVRCLKEGLWLLEDKGKRFAVFLEPGNFMQRAYGDVGLRFQVATPNEESGTSIAQGFFRHLERSVQEARSYRGKILSLEQAAHGYSGSSTGIKVHKLRTVERDQVILPRKTLELLERNVVQFVRQRPQLAKLGLSTKKGLLFYGPPGVGKTHTLHYLAGSLEGMTTLLISAEQVGLLGEYMTLARLLQPSMVVIEDADLIARERTTMESVCEEVLLNKLLNEMDGLTEEADVLFVLTTNRPETLEAALASRPGRIDQAIEFPLPDEEGRGKLVRLYSRGLAVPEDVVRATVKKTEKVSGAFIKELMRRAAQFRLERDGSSELSLADIDNALEELLFAGGSLNRQLLGAHVEAPDC
jgi:tetratricopeptide (TPR) repeat protein